MISILIIEDDISLSNGIVIALKNEDYLFIQAGSLTSAWEYIKNTEIGLIILDINLPDGSGLYFLKELRDMSCKTPVIILTANDMETDVVSGLESGADDYITKPFSLMILRARVNARLRGINDCPTDFIRVDDLMFRFDKMQFTKNNVPVELSKTEQKLLRMLIENRGRMLSRATLMDSVWTDGAEYVDENALSVVIKRLRNKLEDNPSSPQYIKTVYGIGYTWAMK